MEMGVRTRAGAIATILVGIVVVAAGLGHSPTLVAFGSTAPTVAANQPKPPAIKSGAHLYTPANFEVAAPKVRLARATKHTLAVHPATRPKVKLAIAKLEAPEQEPMVLVVTWQTATAGMFENLTYAAVPTRHGWLFVQL